MNTNIRKWLKASPIFFQDAMGKYLGNRSLDVFYRSYRGCLLLTPIKLSTKEPEYVAYINTVGIIINIFLDDKADIEGNEKIVLEAKEYINLPTTRLNNDFTKIWDIYISIIKQSDKFKKYEKIFIQEWANLMDSLLASVRINKGEYIDFNNRLRALSSNMHYKIKFIVDIMYADEINFDLFTDLYEFIELAERITRLGNWVKSWEKELDMKNRDITSGVFCVLVDNNYLSIDDLDTLPKSKIKELVKTTKAEKFLLNKIKEYFNRLEAFDLDSSVLKKKNYILNLENVINQQLRSKSEER